MYVLHLNFMPKIDEFYNVLQDNHYKAQFFEHSKPHQKAKTIHRKLVEGPRVVILYIKGLSEQ